MILNFELVPQTSWFGNLRKFLKQREWDVIRRDAYEKAEGKCMICGAKVSRLEAHETWSYDEESGLQRLEDVRAICHKCHESVHIGLANINGRFDEAILHYMKVNQINGAEAMDRYYMAANEWHRRNQIQEWKYDLGWLEKNGYEFKVDFKKRP